ncbi:MAG: LamG domain-containing protein [Candidatus Parcubacteria bacterium]|nr:LamG domain-containing protein [Candidatus Parcubacteria bacterium]
MLYLFFLISYLLDFIILILFIFLFLRITQLIKSLGEKYSFGEKLHLAPELIVANPSATFDKYGQKNNKGTYLKSFEQYKKNSRTVKKIIQGTLGFLALKFIIISLIFLNIPRPGEAQPKFINALSQANDFQTFKNGTFTLTQWDKDGVTLQAGALSGNFISPVIGDGKNSNQWENLTWQTDKIYNQKPAWPKSTLAAWSLDSLTDCTASGFASFKCENKIIGLTKGIYNSSAYDFDGFNSKVKISQNLTFTGSFTIGAWIQPSVNIINGSEDINYAILTKAFGNYMDKKPYALRYDYFFGFKNGSLALIFWPDSNQDHWVMAKNTKYNFAPARWYHVAGVYDDKAKTIKLYIDGVEQTTQALDYDGGKINYSPNTKDNFPTWIGCAGYRWLGNEEKIVNVFKGSLDEVFLNNSALGVLDIRNLVNLSGEIYFQVRTGNILPLTGPFWGPEGKQASYFFKPTPDNLDFLGQSKYLQYIAYFSRTNLDYFPKLNNVNVNYLTAEPADFKISLTNENIIPQIPEQRDLSKEKNAISLFFNFFKSQPKTSDDWNFVNFAAYNQANKRNLDQEIPAVIGYIKKMKKLPISDSDWGLVKALAYTDKGGLLLKNWQK